MFHYLYNILTAKDISLEKCISYFRTYLEIDPRVKYVVCGVKLWMKLTGLKIGFLTVAQVWLALFFLMQKGIIPSVEELRKTMPRDRQTRIVNGESIIYLIICI